MKIPPRHRPRPKYVPMAAAALLVLGGCAVFRATSSVQPDVPSDRSAAADQGGESGAQSTAETPMPGVANESGADSITVVANGDILIHNSLWLQAERDGGGQMDFSPQLAGIKSRVADADLALCHLETPLAPAGGPYANYPVFSTPPQIADTIKDMGYDGCSTVSNHTLDQGFAGVKRTLDTLDRLGIGHAGSARSESESKRAKIYTVKGVKVAHLAYASNFNGYSVPSGQPWCCNEVSAPKMISDARAAREAGAQVVIVSVHAGDENVARPSYEQRALAKQLADSNAVDLVIGNHVHVVQPVEKIGKMWVAYGHGNLLSGQYESWRRNREGLTTSFTFSRQSDGSYFVTKAIGYPTFNAANPSRLVDLVTTLPRSGGDARMVEAYRMTKSTALSLGAARDGFTVPDPGQ